MKALDSNIDGEDSDDSEPPIVPVLLPEEAEWIRDAVLKSQAVLDRLTRLNKRKLKLMPVR
jgi:hypothetical protein